MRSQLKQANIDKNSSPYWNAEYNYRKDGNLDSRQIQDAYSTFTYDGDLLLTAGTSSPQDPAGWVGHWKMDDNTASINVIDSSVYGNNGTFNDPTGNPNTDAHHTAGMIDGALTFDGTDDYVNCGGDSSLMNRQTVTASAWIKADSFSRGDGYNVFMVVCLEQANTHFDWGLRVDSGFPKFWVLVPSGYKSAASTSAISTGEWYHLAGTWDRYGGSDNLKIYVNGVLKATNTVNENLRTYGTQISIGRELHPTVNEYFDGVIDDVMIFDRALSSDEITALYNRVLSLDWDDNGNMAATTLNGGLDFTYNWDNKLRQVKQDDSTIMSVKYDQDGNRIFKDSSQSGQCKYIVDVVGNLPTILLEIEPGSGEIMKSYIYANGQVLCQNDGDYSAPRYFYIHDRLGSVRQVVNDQGQVRNYYTYQPFGEIFDTENIENVSNPFKFTGQWLDTEIDQYYLRARQYDPHIYRFTSRDLVLGKFEEPMTLHRYLYCLNDPINCIDPRGLETGHIMFSSMFSVGFSLMYQFGIVWDDKGNVGFIVTSDDPHPTDAFEKDWGLGCGIPAVSVGVSIGWTNANEIFDLEGEGISVGASIGTPLWGPSIGVDYIQGVQRSGEYYYGFEVIPGYSAGSFGWEAHGHATWTTVTPLNSNQLQGRDIVGEFMENAIFDVETVGQGYFLLYAWGKMQ